MKISRLPLVFLGLIGSFLVHISCERSAFLPSSEVWMQRTKLTISGHRAQITDVSGSPTTANFISTKSDLTYQKTLDKLIEFATRGSTIAANCGQIARPARSDDIAKCGIRAFSKREPFYLLYYSSFETRFMSHGVAADADGNVVEMSYDSKRWIQVGFPKRSYFSDDGRLVTTLCLKPISLIRTEDFELACAIPLSPSSSATKIPTEAIDTTICEIEKDPAAFNNKLVRVRGSVSINFEYSTIEDDSCPPSMGLWFALGGGASPPGLIATVKGGAREGAEDDDGRIIPSFRVTLVRDSNFRKFNRLLHMAMKADQQSAKVDSDEYDFHQVTATFVGRVDGVSPEIHAFHSKRKPTDNLDYLGFGQAGQFDAQLVVRSVEGDAVQTTIHFQKDSSKTN